jgi:GT2 family glycosyltransferase
MSVSIGVLMTAHNRRQKTLSCLAALFAQRIDPSVHLSVYLVDDGSSDGTSDAVRQQFPSVHVIAGSGNLYWVGGMRAAYDAAAKSPHDYQLWLNDDTVLYPNAITTLLATARDLTSAGHANAIVTGATRDPSTRHQVSGGFHFKWHRVFMRFELVEPAPTPRPCDTTAGNCLFVPRTVYETLGNLSKHYVHVLGDLDYGLRAIESGYTIWQAPDYLGETPDDHPATNQVYELPTLGTVFRQLRNPKGLNYGSNFQHRFLPTKEWTDFLRRFRPMSWPIAWLLTYRKLVTLLVRRAFRRGSARAVSVMSRLRGSAP